MANQLPGSPPPLQPRPGGNPYDFITTAQQVQKPGGSKAQRIAIVAGLAMVLITIIIIVITLLGSAGSESRNDYQNLVQQHAEILRISTVGVEKARGADAKNLAITAKLSLQTLQADVNGIAGKAGASVDPETLALGADPETDTLLTAAEQDNRFDETFAAKLTELLNEYRQTAQRLYDQSSNTETKSILEQTYNASGQLMQNGKP